MYHVYDIMSCVYIFIYMLGYTYTVCIRGSGCCPVHAGRQVDGQLPANLGAGLTTSVRCTTCIMFMEFIKRTYLICCVYSSTTYYVTYLCLTYLVMTAIYVLVEAVAAMFLVPLPFEVIAGSLSCSCGNRPSQEGLDQVISRAIHIVED